MGEPTVMSHQAIELWLLRHAHAGDPARWKGDDAARPLSSKGRAQAERLAAFLVAHGQRVDAIVSSPKVRAVQTAQPVAAGCGLELRVEPRLVGLDLAALEAVLDDLGTGAREGGPRRIMLVGHDPDFSALATALTGAVDLTMRKGALARIDVVRPIAPGGGTLVWLLPPQLLEPAPSADDGA